MKTYLIYLIVFYFLLKHGNPIFSNKKKSNNKKDSINPPYILPKPKNYTINNNSTNIVIS